MGGCTKQLNNEKDHTGNKKKLIKCVSERDKLRTIRRWRRKNNFRSVNGFFEEMKSERCWGLVNVETRQSGEVVEYAIPNGYQKPDNICPILISPHTTQNLPSHYPSSPSHTYMNHSFAVPINNIIFKGVTPRATILLNYSAGTKSGNNTL